MKKIKENIGEIRGTFYIKTYKGGTLEKAKYFFDQAKVFAAKGMPDIVAINLRKAKRIMSEGYIATPVVQKNLVMQSPNYGRDLIIQRLVGQNTYSLNILYCEIGTGTATPNINDTALTTPVARAAVSFQQDYATTTAILQFFFPDLSLINETYHEVGSFVDGSSSIGSGQIFNHALLSPAYVKVAGQDTTIEIDFGVS